MSTSTSISGSLHDILLNNIVPLTYPVEIRPHRFIVAWHGVLTLCFEAWPKPLVNIKRRISNLPEFCATPENFGTRWPKLTLAALNDDAPPLTMDQLRRLTDLCKVFDDELQKLFIPLSHCSIVMFGSRSLTHCLCRVDYEFMKKDSETDGKQEYDEESYKIVQNVVQETEQLDTYLAKANANGHRWGQHYNTVWTETTLACFLTNNGNGEQGDDTTSSSTSRLLELITSFQARVDALLPGCYTWMPQQSLHLSLRALDNRSNQQRNEG